MRRMSKRFRHAAIVGKYQARGIRAVLEEVAHFLVAQGLEVSFEADTAAATGVTDFDTLPTDELGPNCDLVVVVGGDGTMLGIGRQLARHNTPLVGINQGRLGFITDI
jgi:NAD+ kinase